MSELAKLKENERVFKPIGISHKLRKNVYFKREKANDDRIGRIKKFLWDFCWRFLSNFIIYIEKPNSFYKENEGIWKIIIRIN